MSRSLLACSLFVVAAAAQGQLEGQEATDSVKTARYVVRAEAWLDYNANSIHNELPIAIWKGSYLERDLRERSRASLHERNSVGYVLGARITGLGEENEQGWRMMASVSQQQQMGARFTRDLYSMTFFGNAGYEDRRADLGPSAVTSIRYSTVGIGQMHNSGSYWRMDMVAGQGYEQVDARWASLYTGVDGRVLRANVLSDYHRSDTTKGTWADGIGVAVSGRWETRIGRGPNDVRFSIEAQDLGFVNWFGHTIVKDTTIEFTGIGVESILDLDNVIIGEDQVLDTFGLRYGNGQFTKPLPFLLKGRVRAPLGLGWAGSITLDQRYLPGYVPQLAFSGERVFAAGTMAGATLSFGGFGGLRLGARVQQGIGEHVLLQLSSPHLPGFFTTKARSAGLQFCATVCF